MRVSLWARARKSASHPLNIQVVRVSHLVLAENVLSDTVAEPTDNDLLPFFDLRIYKVSPPLEHFLSLISILCPVVHAPGARLLVRQRFLYPVGVKPRFMEQCACSSSASGEGYWSALKSTPVRYPGYRLGSHHSRCVWA